jgi:hypothetical protein
MRRLLALTAALVIGTLAARHAFSVGNPDEKQPAKQWTPPKEAPWALYPEMLDEDWIRTRGVPRRCSGNVSEIGKDSLTLTFLPTTEEVYRPGPDGQLVFVKVNQVPAPPPRKFPLSSLLAEGKAYTKRGPEHSYRIADVKLGDWVEVTYHKRPDKTDCCDNICIWRRPGGTVPPAPDDKLPASERWHNKRNAQQFANDTLAPKWVPWMLTHFGR